jgi:hypothetical protein
MIYKFHKGEIVETQKSKENLFEVKDQTLTEDDVIKMIECKVIDPKISFFMRMVLSKMDGSKTIAPKDYEHYIFHKKYEVIDSPHFIPTLKDKKGDNFLHKLATVGTLSGATMNKIKFLKKIRETFGEQIDINYKNGSGLSFINLVVPVKIPKENYSSKLIWRSYRILVTI